MSSVEDNKVIVIVGPTGVGKTDISIHLAQKFNGEIISADSRTFYIGMDIGTAKPSKSDQQTVKHYMVDVADPGENISLATFQKTSIELINLIRSKGKTPFIVGGTGQYIRAITHGWDSPAVAPQLKLRRILESISQEKGYSYLHDNLAHMDPSAAEKIDPRNVRRTIRALEVIFTTGKTFSSQRKKGRQLFNYLLIGLTRPREELYERIDQRIETMFEKGFISEVMNLLEVGYSENTPSLSAIGYPECIRVIKGEITESEAKTEIKRKTRIFVRRQANWFKPGDESIKWFDLSSVNLEDIEDYIRNKLRS
jgi:tRNA dimethylallyltransferase